MKTRRDFLKLSALAASSVLLPWKWTARAFAAIPGGTLPPEAVPKYATPLVIPPVMPQTFRPGVPRSLDYYEIAVRQFPQQILPPGWPPTTVWSYGSANHPGTFNYPAFTIAARANRPVRVKWINDLKDAAGHFRPHLLAVDPTLHWANPSGGEAERDTRPTFLSTPGPYLGPVPIVTHVHGAHTAPESDGYPEAWWLPNASNIPPGYATRGTFFDQHDHRNREPGTAVFQYPNDQRATTLWYHDHTLGMTRLNVYAGPAGFYLIGGGKSDLPAGILPGPAPVVGSNPFGRFYVVPIAIQDRSFNADGSLFYPASREFFDEYEGPYVPDTDLSPYWNPEVFANTMVVNGRTWPYLEVEPRRYRLRLLNGCNSRFLILKVVTDPLASRPASPLLPFAQIGAEGGFLPAPVELPQLLIAPAERADVIVDFSTMPVGAELFLINEGPDEPFGGGQPNLDFPAADPLTTGQVMKFVVVPPSSIDTSLPADQLTLPAFTGLGAADKVRRLSLNEAGSAYFDGPAEAMLGAMVEEEPEPMQWMDPITENPKHHSTEIWELHNFTEDAHPIHIHLVQFQVVDRQPFDEVSPLPPEPWETGYKDTVIAYPEQITRVKAKFDIRGRYVWHCHIVEHEDNEMMRPYEVV